jgi:Tfp pilus assembly protein PilV
MAKLITKKVAGSTLIEVLIAMVIIMVIFAIGIRIFGNVMRSGVSFEKIKAQQQLQLLAKEIQKEGTIASEDLKIDHIDYHFTSDTSAVKGFSKLAIQAYQQGKLLGSIKCFYKEKGEAYEN